MIDPFVVLTPVLVLGVMALVWFIGCDSIFGIQSTGLLTASDISYRQGGAGFENFQGGGISSISTAMALPNVGAKDLMVVWIWYESTAVTVSTVTDSAGNQYQRAVGPTAGTSAGANGLAGWQQEIWWAIMAANAASLSLTATFTNNVANGQMAISPHDFNTSGAGLTLDHTASKTGIATGKGIVGTDQVSDPDSEADLIFGAAIFGGGGGTQGSGFYIASLQQVNVAEFTIPPLEAEGTLAATFVSDGKQEWIAQAVTFTFQ